MEFADDESMLVSGSLKSPLKIDDPLSPIGILKPLPSAIGYKNEKELKALKR